MKILQKIDEYLNEAMKKCKGCGKKFDEDELEDGYCEDCEPDDEDDLDESTMVFNKKEYTTKEFKSDKEANKFLEKNDDYGVIGEKNGKVYVAKKSDKGKPVK